MPREMERAEEGVVEPTPEEAPLEYIFCSSCRDHTVFEWDADEKGWLSVCCYAKPVPCDVD